MLEVRRVQNFSRKYTGLDTLIRIDGYFFRIDSAGAVNGPAFMLSKNGEFRTTHLYLENHIQIQERFKTNRRHSRIRRGSYALSGDTITARWVSRFDLMSYDIFSSRFIILNDTTLKEIWHFCETGCGQIEQPDPVRSDIYRFFQFDVDVE